MNDTTDSGYIYVKGWEKFQHPDALRRAGPGVAWIKIYIDLLDNDAYRDLPLGARTVLHGIWMLTARCGQGRCNARASYLQQQLNLPPGVAQRSLKRLSDAGFIAVRARKAQAGRKQTASLEREEKRRSPTDFLEERENARASARAAHRNGKGRGLSAAELGRLAEEARRAEAEKAAS